MKRLLLILVASALLPATACSLRQKPTGQDFYAQGQLDFAQKEYKAAIENYQHVIDQFPFSPYAEDAEMKIGLAYYQQKDYAEAIGALDDFQRMHPTSQNLELVTYYIGMSYYDQMGREDQDQTKTQQALKRFQELEQRFPEGSFAELAHEKVVVCREMLARNQLVVGNYYYKRANFRAAESRFAELMQKYPDTPVAPDALFELGISLEKEGKKYSAAQAFTAVEKHFPNSNYAKRAADELRKLHEPIDTEEDPLPLVLAETGYGGNPDDTNADKIVVRQRGDSRRGSVLASAAPARGPAPTAYGSAPTAYGSDGLPVLDGAPRPNDGAAPRAARSQDMMHAADAPSASQHASPGSIAGAAAAQARAMTGPAESAPPEQLHPTTALPDSAPEQSLHPATALPDSAPEQSLHSVTALGDSPPDQPLHPMTSGPSGDSAPLSLTAAEPPATGPATLKTVRLSSNDPPLSVILELSGPVHFDKNLESNPEGAIATVVLKDVTPDSALQTHLVFDRSIFKDCSISSSSSGTTVTLNTQPVAHFAVVPLEAPPRLLMTFTPEKATQKTSSAR
ncbi:MAG: outer membrane protein assembly factor BamD [Candidatus Binataceae bacterium]|jgi:outer membrane protein assembly factor BamD|nr:outer membrane protein assembly factor BamD [Candidatus Binataceae bacterium]